MGTKYYLHANELDLSILKSIKAAFRGRDIEMIVTEATKRKKEALIQRMDTLRNMPQSESSKKKVSFSAVSISTNGFKLNRDEANAR